MYKCVCCVYLGTTFKHADVLWAGAVTWEHPDNILRVFSHNNKPLINLMPPNPYDKVIADICDRVIFLLK